MENMDKEIQADLVDMKRYRLELALTEIGSLSGSEKETMLPALIDTLLALLSGPVALVEDLRYYMSSQNLGSTMYHIVESRNYQQFDSLQIEQIIPSEQWAKRINIVSDEYESFLFMFLKLYGQFLRGKVNLEDDRPF